MDEEYIIGQRYLNRKILETVIGLLFIALTVLLMFTFKEFFFQRIEVTYLGHVSLAALIFAIEMILLFLLFTLGPVTKINKTSFTLEDYQKSMNKAINKV